MGGEWLAQLPDDLKENETFTSFETLGDFAKAHIDTVGRVSELDGRAKDFEGRLTNLQEKIATDYIPKLTDQSTDEDKTAFYRLLGVPEKAQEYDFPKGEGVEHDDKMVAWAKDTFHKANLNVEQAGLISQAWDGFITGMVEAEKEAMETKKTEAETKLKEDWGADFDKNIELTKRAFKQFSGADFDAFLDETGLGNHPVLIRTFYEIGKAMGDDYTPPGRPGGEDDRLPGMIYDKSPKPQ